MKHQEVLTSYIASFVAELTNIGIKDIVVSPGSRSTPIAMLMAEHPQLRLHIHVDERSAGFFALGIAKASRRAAVLLCTSGTAAANYFPAIVEAYYARVPLIVLTADRPHELRDNGAPQAINQIELYGKHVKWFTEMAPPENHDEMLRYVRTTCGRAFFAAMNAPAGPVHLNFPLREPLIPNLEKEVLFAPSFFRENRYVAFTAGERTLTQEQVVQISQLISNAEKGIIVCGAIEEEQFAEVVLSLAKKLQYPILADPLSQLRSSGRNDFLIDTYDSILRSQHAKHLLKPDLIIRFGAMPVSKALTSFIKANDEAHQLVIDGGDGWRDPTLRATEMIYCQETAFCRAIVAFAAGEDRSAYLELWRDMQKISEKQLSAIENVKTLSEVKFYQLLNSLLPDESILFVGNSMPIRDVDTFFRTTSKKIRMMANRGTNGIDGVISTALGAAVISKPLYLVIGDLSFYHDLNGLLMAKLSQIDITIILINNNGGGIFSFLPQAAHRKHFEQLFGTPLDLDFSHIVRMYHGSYIKISDWDELTSSFQQNIANKGLRVIEITTNRERNVEEHRKLWDNVSREICRYVGAEQ
ncbi:2-succinyl-5-enolpyruvyl-6-hydroxy-3-cyclohexene-1-carboxylic-acid synthase [Bacillaceae bacterium Marseille-Q3522]|nr:2-succinyl-5-enolpyruvyl-6-hydroxy-3-cyclohexene-1-carboxylic-acid synthase [Bacillaceae bacterium Marseille-Q3522]